LKIGWTKVDFHKEGKDPFYIEELKIYVMGWARTNLQLNKNIGERPSGPIAVL